MKKTALIFVLILGIFIRNAFAQSMVNETITNGQLRSINAVSFPDYPPFSYISGKYAGLNTVFRTAFDGFAKDQNYKIEYLANPDYTNAVQKTKQGDIDLLLGIYYATKLYSGIEYIFPAVLHNPVHVITLPHNIANVNNIEDLKNLKGIYIQTEHFSDYMINNFKNYNIKPVANAYDAYEQLFTGKVDFIVGSYYYNYVYALQIGVKDYIAFSRKPLWNMPLFIGVSKASKNHANVINNLKRYIMTDTFKSDMNDGLHEIIGKFETQSVGIVPPKFVRIDSFKELTPAEERLLQQTQTQEQAPEQAQTQEQKQEQE